MPLQLLRFFCLGYDTRGRSRAGVVAVRRASTVKGDPERVRIERRARATAPTAAIAATATHPYVTEEDIDISLR